MAESTDVLVLEDRAETRRVIDATLRVVARFGLAKLTLDDVAREAGMSRATLYRRFPGKAALLEAVVASEADRLRRGIDGALADVSNLPDALMASAAFGAREFAGHPALQFLLAHEPGAVLPALCFDGAERVLSAVAGCIEPHLCRFMPRLEARRTGEWIGRIVLSYGCTPAASMASGPCPPGIPPLRDGAPTPFAQSGRGDAEATVLSVVRDFVIPALNPEVPDAC